MFRFARREEKGEGSSIGITALVSMEVVSRWIVGRNIFAPEFV